MGANYYWIEEDTTCPHCERRDPEENRIHIGKSSAGWCFSLHVDPSIGINNLDDWLKLFAKPNSFIEDEYGYRVSVEEMIENITQRKWDMPFCDERFKSRFANYLDENDFHRRNDSERGLNNLLRHRISQYCIGHGEGTYDLMVGIFS